MGDTSDLDLRYSGDELLPAGAAVLVRSPEGDVAQIPTHQLELAQRQGYQVAPPEALKEFTTQAKYGSHPALAAAAAAGRGLTLGLSDEALTRSGLVEPETLAGLKAANPTSSTAAELGGAVLPALIPGVGEAEAASGAARLAGSALRASPAALVGRAGEAVAAAIAKGTAQSVVQGALRKAGARALEGAVQGGLYGAGNVLSEDALGDPNLTASAAIHEIGLSTLFGGGLGAGLGLVEASMPKLARRAQSDFQGLGEAAGREPPGPELPGATPGTPPVTPGGGGAPAAPPGVAGPGAGPAATVPQTVGRWAQRAQELVEEHAPVIADTIRAAGVDMPSAENLVLRHLDLTGRQVEKLEDRELADVAARSLLDDPRYRAATTKEKAVDLIDTKRIEAADQMQKSISRMDSLANRGQRPSGEAIAERIRQIAKPFENGLAAEEPLFNTAIREAEAFERQGNMTFEGAWDFRKRLKNAAKFDATKPTGTADLYRQMYRAVDQEIKAKGEEVAISSGNLGLIDDWVAGNRSYAQMAALQEQAEKRLSFSHGNRVFGLTDHLISGIAGGIGALVGGPAGALAGAAIGGIGNKWARERLPHIMALALDQTRNKAVALGALEAAANRTSSTIDRGISDLFSERAGARPGGGGAGVGWTSPTIGARPGGAGAGAPPTPPSSGLTGAGRGAAVAPIPAALAGRAGSTAVTIAAKAGQEKADSYEHRVQQVEALQDPEQLSAALERATGMLYQHAPGTSAALQNKLISAVSVLAGALPKRNRTGVKPLQLQPSPAAKARFDRVFLGASTPTAVLGLARAGTLTADHLKGASIHPEVLDEIRSRLTAEIGKHEDLPQGLKHSLSLLLGAPVDSTNAADFITGNQAIYLAGPERQAQAARPQPAADKLTLADRLNPRPERDRDT